MGCMIRAEKVIKNDPVMEFLLLFTDFHRFYESSDCNWRTYDSSISLEYLSLPRITSVYARGAGMEEFI